MGILADFVAGFADKTVADADEQRKRMAEMDDWEKKQLFLQKLEEAASRKKPVGSRFENGKMIYVNAYGEPVFERNATEQELLTTQASAAEARGTIFKNDPKRLEQADADARAKLEFGLLESQARVRASEASAAESGARRGLIDSQRKILEATGGMPGRGGSSDSLPYRIGTDEARASGAIDKYANNLDPSRPEDLKTLQYLDSEMTRIEAIQDPQKRAAELIRLSSSLPEE